MLSETIPLLCSFFNKEALLCFKEYLPHSSPPFTEDNQVDEVRLGSLVERQLNAGIAGLVPVGTSGECPTLNDEETEQVIRTVVEKTAGRVPVIAGAGSNCTSKAVALTKKVKELGADAVLQVVPYYNKPSQQGLIEHFSAIADEVDIPIVLYDVPGRTAASLDTSTILKLAEHPRIVGVKSACGDITQIMELVTNAPADFDILSGDDMLILPIMLLGGKGVISVVSNLYPEQLIAMTDACLNGEWIKAKEIHYRMMPLFRAAFVESNPIPIKAAMAMKGIILEQYRKPLCSLSVEHRSELSNVLDLIDSRIATFS